jgi:hypothetical protein
MASWLWELAEIRNPARTQQHDWWLTVYNLVNNNSSLPNRLLLRVVLPMMLRLLMLL